MKLMTIICVATGYILGAILYDLYKDRRKKKRESITLEEKAKEFVSKRASGTSQEMDYYANYLVEFANEVTKELEKQLEQTKILLNAEREVNEKKEYLQYTEYLMDQAKKLKEEKAELIICLQSELDEVIAENIKLKKELYETEGSKGLKGVLND